MPVDSSYYPHTVPMGVQMRFRYSQERWYRGTAFEELKKIIVIKISFFVPSWNKGPNIEASTSNSD